jgi:hypothetical protein
VANIEFNFEGCILNSDGESFFSAEVENAWSCASTPPYIFTWRDA